MTVRVNKPSLNIREKLSELERPIGLKGGEIMAADTAQEVRDFVSAGRKNLIINGDMRIAQRGTSFTINGGNSIYTLDRWAVSRGSISSLTVTKNTSTGLDAHPNALKVECTADASQSSSTDTWIRYGVEDIDFQNILNYPNTNKHISLSFWARANTAGQYSVSVTAGGFSAAMYVSPFTLNANTWEYKTVTIPPPAQWSTSSGYGLRIYFDLGSGTTYQTSAVNQWIYSTEDYSSFGNTRVTGVNGRTFEITGVQLEVGKNATEFEHRSYGEELALCQRYYYASVNHHHVLFKNSFWESNTFYFPVTMRTAPSVSLTGSPGTLHLRLLNSGSDVINTPVYNTFTDGFLLTSSATNNDNFYTWILNGTIRASAEL